MALLPVHDSVLAQLHEANAAHTARYPGESSARQPVHTVYGGAHLFKADSAAKLGAVARRFLEQYAPDAPTLAEALALPGPPALTQAVYDRIAEKLTREPVEDFRIDFEDGFGNRPDTEEDACAVSAAGEVAAGLAAGTLPPFIGIRIKPFSEELHRRSIRTLTLFLSTLLEATGNRLPPGFAVTLPKVVNPAQVSALVDLFDLLERSAGLESGSLRLELMVETPQSLIDSEGRAVLPQLVHTGGGRCIAAHFGVYDFTASMGITAAYQSMQHPSCDAARQLMQIALGGTGIWLSDGATNVLPVPRHSIRAAALSQAQLDENRATVHAAWRLHYEDVRHSLVNGYYQGWDLHPAQLVTRYAALYAFFLEGLEVASARLRNFVQQAAQATMVGDVFDDAATGQGLLNYFLRGLNSGAITEAEAMATGLSIEELETRSFATILAGRREP